jgi:hypothetical protein
MVIPERIFVPPYNIFAVSIAPSFVIIEPLMYELAGQDIVTDTEFIATFSSVAPSTASA